MKIFAISFVLIGVSVLQTDAATSCINCYYSEILYDNNTSSGISGGSKDCWEKPEEFKAIRCNDKSILFESYSATDQVIRCLKSNIVLEYYSRELDGPAKRRIQWRGCKYFFNEDYYPGDGKWSNREIEAYLTNIDDDGGTVIEAEVYSCSSNSCNAAVSHVSYLSNGSVLLIALVTFVIQTVAFQCVDCK